MRGRDKLAEIVDGHVLLRRQAVRALMTKHPVTVLVPADGRRDALVSGLPALRVVHTDTMDHGLGSTLRAAARAVRNGPMAILLPDIPGVDVEDIRAVFAAFEEGGGKAVTRASDPEGRPGTPVVIPARLLAAFAHLERDHGGRDILAGERVTLVRFPDDRATRDLDTPEDWAAWRADQPRKT